MFKPINIIVITIFFIFLLFSLTFSQESMTITTYYPSPYGSYNELRLYPHSPATTSCNSSQEGLMYYDSNAYNLYVCRYNGTTYAWELAAGGYWTASGNDIYNTNTGNVGIGTASPGGKLSVSGGAAMGSPYASTAVGDGVLIVSGRVGIGTPWPAPVSRLDLGSGCMAGFICSDVRMKESILPMLQEQSYVAKLMQLQGVSFEWKNLRDRKRYFGLIAQEVEKVIPEVVTTSDSEEGSKGLSCVGLEAVLVEAIKEQQKEINALKQEISVLKTKFNIR